MKYFKLDSSCVITSLILIDNLIYKALIIQEEIACSSLLTLNALSQIKVTRY